MSRLPPPTTGQHMPDLLSPRRQGTLALHWAALEIHTGHTYRSHIPVTQTGRTYRSHVHGIGQALPRTPATCCSMGYMIASMLGAATPLHLSYNEPHTYNQHNDIHNCRC